MPNVIDLGPGRWSKMGQQFGAGMSQGLSQVLQLQLQRELEKEQAKRQWQDLRSVMEGLGYSGFEGVKPTTTAGVEMIGELMPSIMKQRAKTTTIDYWTEKGEKRSKTVPEAGRDKAIKKIIEAGGTLEEPRTITMSKVLESGRIGKAKNVIPDSERYNKLIDKGFSPWGITGQGAKPSAKEEEIQRYLDLNIAKDRQTAVKLAEGLIEVGQDRFGRSILIDKSTGEKVGEPTREGTPAIPEGETEDRLMSMEDVKRAFGPIATMKRTFNNLFGFLLPGVPFPKEEEAANKVRLFNQRMRPLLQVSQRGARWDVERMDQFLPTPKTFKDPDAAKFYIGNLRNMIVETIKGKQNILNTQELTEQQFRQFNDDIQKLQSALYLLPREEGELTVEAIQKMEADEIKNLDVGTLTDEQKDAVRQRIQEIKEKRGQ